ncbi:MAG: antitoxin PrlF [Cryptosporangiaceae bacterium]|nr:antitoxin PrlF [Cryptosporangiaceae bacterium]
MKRIPDPNDAETTTPAAEKVTAGSDLLATAAESGKTETVARRTAARRVLSAPIRSKGVVTIPQQVREQLHLQEGDNLIVAVEDGRIVLTPATLLPRDQAWFWTPEWQAKEAEADAAQAAGDTRKFSNDEAFLAALHEH